MPFPVKYLLTCLVFLDINECEQRDTCQHECMNTPGSHRCLCPSGYRLMTNGKTCQGKKLKTFNKNHRQYMLTSLVSEKSKDSKFKRFVHCSLLVFV